MSERKDKNNTKVIDKAPTTIAPTVDTTTATTTVPKAENFDRVSALVPLVAAKMAERSSKKGVGRWHRVIVLFSSPPSKGKGGRIDDCRGISAHVPSLVHANEGAAEVTVNVLRGAGFHAAFRCLNVDETGQEYPAWQYGTPRTLSPDERAAVGVWLGTVTVPGSPNANMAYPPKGGAPQSGL